VIDCINAEVRDALPDLLNGNLSGVDASLLQDHVDGCAACRSELDLLREIKAGSAIVPAMNAAAIAARIASYAPAYVVGEERRTNSFAWTWKAAAAVAIVTAGIFGLTRGSPSRQAPTASTSAPSVVASVAGVDPETRPAPEKQPVAVQASGETQVAALSVGGLQDLSDADLEELLSDLNGMDAIPSAEPQSLTPVIDDAGVDQ
jgi:hypothetical protein